MGRLTIKTKEKKKLKRDLFNLVKLEFCAKNTHEVDFSETLL